MLLLLDFSFVVDGDLLVVVLEVVVGQVVLSGGFSLRGSGGIGTVSKGSRMGVVDHHVQRRSGLGRGRREHT